MAGSFMARLRERMEQLQTELQPEAAGFDRRAYGYEDEPEAEDATFEDVEREEESPWRRDPPPDAPRPEPAPAGPTRPAHGSPARASAPPPTRAARREAFDPFGVGGRQSGGGIRGGAPSPPPWEAPARARTSGPPGAGVRSTPHDPEPRSIRGATRSRRLRARLRQPESLRELFLLREVIDRPIALRRRFRGR